MNDPFRLRVLKALSASIETVTVSNGYQHDLAGRVHRGRLALDHTDEIPAVAINEKPVFPESLEVPDGSPAGRVRLELIVQGFADDDRNNPADPAYRLLADVQRRLAYEKTRDGGFNVLGLKERVTMQIGQGVVRPPDGVVSDTAFFWLPVTLEFGERLNDPFA